MNDPTPTIVPAAGPPPAFHRGVLALDAPAAVERIRTFLHDAVARRLHRRGAVVAVSGGVDSAVCAALAVHTFGADRVHTLFLPGQNSSPASGRRARELCAQLGVALEERPIEPALRELGCYAARDAAIRQVFPDYRPGDRYKIAIAEGLLERDRANVFELVIERPDGTQQRERLPLDAYLQLVAATNMKQRTRTLLSYHAAERRNYAVIGTPNRLEYAQGFFVRGGDGLADCKPIAHLYKTQVYALAAHLGVPQSIRDEPPSTDTYSLPQTQQEFFFALPYGELDLLLWAQDHGVPVDEVARGLGLGEDAVLRAFRDLDRKRAAAQILHQHALLAENVP